MRPLQEFLGEEAAGGALLLAAALAALIWANLPGDSYHDFWARTADFGSGRLPQTLRDWINDGLMTVFFFVVGLEIKREISGGELASRRAAALPIAAALGGMVVPAAIYAALNTGGDGSRGWGVPMATDIAFAVGALSLLGTRVPLTLKLFLLALAIADDIGAIVVIAAVYSEGVAGGWLAASIAVLAVTGVCARAGVRSLWVYAVLAVAAWAALHESGVHPTLAGVAVALLMPAGRPGEGAAARTSRRLEYVLHPWSTFVIVPLFALANAGIDLGGGVVRDAATSPVSLGVALGLVVGKPLGIVLFSLLAVRAGLASLPARVRWPQLVGAGCLAGIGFTVSLFISELAFEDAVLVDDAKIGILAGSLTAGATGLVALGLSSRAAAREAPIVEASQFQRREDR